MTKFTTPLTASEPYTAEAPPVTMSARCSSIDGTKSASTSPCGVVFITRLPSNSTSVRVTPMLRRFRERYEPFCELLPGFDCGLRPPANTGRVSRPSTTVRGVIVNSCSADTTVTGVGLLSPFEMTREPVTMTSVSVSASSPAGVCAPAIDASVNAAAAPNDLNTTSLRLLMSNPLCCKLSWGPLVAGP